MAGNIWDLVAKLENIENKCIPDKKDKNNQVLENLDAFTILKKKIAKEVRETRKLIEERNELMDKGKEAAETVKLSNDVRWRIKAIQKDTEYLDNIRKDEAAKVLEKAKGKPITAEQEKVQQVRAELVELCYKHIDECKHLEKSKYTTDRASLFQASSNVEVPDKLPDIDDPKFQALIEKDQAIDSKLDLVSQGVETLRQMATEMNKEVLVQEVMIETIDNRADKVNNMLDSLNDRMKKTLQGVRKADRFVIDFILLVIVLAIAGYIYNIAK